MTTVVPAIQVILCLTAYVAPMPYSRDGYDIQSTGGGSVEFMLLVCNTTQYLEVSRKKLFIFRCGT